MDIYSKLGDSSELQGQYAGAQCKNTRDLDLRVVRSEASKARSFEPPLSLFSVVVTAERDAGIQEEVRELNESKAFPFEIEVMFWEDVVRYACFDSRIVHKYFAEFMSELANQRQLLTPDSWRAVPSVEDIRASSAVHDFVENSTFDPQGQRTWEEELSRLPAALALGSEALDEALNKGSPFLRQFFEQERTRWSRAISEVKRTTVTDPAVDLVRLVCTDDAELDVVVTNRASTDVVITSISVTVLKDMGYIAPMLHPSAHYSVSISNLRVGDAKRMAVAHVIPAGKADRFFVDLDDLRSLLLHVVFETGGGCGIAGDVWLFPDDD